MKYESVIRSISLLRKYVKVFFGFAASFTQL